MDQLDRGFELKDLSDSGSFSGYGNVYGIVDQGNDIVAHQAFAESLDALKAKGRLPAMLWQHRTGEPIGAYQSVREDAKGLRVDGRLALKTSRGAEAYELLKMGAISGLSIGFESKRTTFDNKSGVRTIHKGDLHEISLVTLPMNDAARVSSVKAIKSLDRGELEQLLRERAGLSQREAKRLLAGGFAALHKSTDDDDEALALAARIRRLINTY